ncbi:phosphoglucosamine mutase [Synechococcus sp. PCC 7502]|uniref:phosphoglucosamine mutase n=1 Tax=Synechococcus sp. PCC 7502 TaxID=1173263 RepID=UPI00029FF3D3|nr:phosphoglucosamine mutase [Synechococcus sp. PCC 7502]AFY73492.1 phosphoglucosamine mutase [Synechococcus sp. PCC 7502]
MKLFGALFGTDGIRGHVGTFLTAPIALQVGLAAGLVLKEEASCSDRPVVLIGQDSRTSGNMLTSALAAGLTSAGLDVWNLGLCPTPTVAYLTSCLPEAIAGVMVSASHNPPEDNGIKFFGADGTKLSKALQAQVEETLQASSLGTTYGSWGNYSERSPLVELYQQSLCKSISTDLQGIKVVLDLAWGAASFVAPKVFTSLGAEVICLHDQPLGDRINVNCGSTCLDPLRAAVQEHKADMGFAFDGDADRVLAVDNYGGIIDGDYILYLWGQHLLESQRLPEARLVTTVMANLGFEKAWQKLGGQMVRTAVGDQYVHAEMLKSGAMLGGEQSGHVLCRHYGVSGDGLLTAIHLAVLGKERSPLSDLMAQSFTPYPQLLKNVRVEDKLKRLHWQECEPVYQALQAAISDLGDRGRVLVRPSGTEPLMRVMVEAETLDLAQYWTDELTHRIKLHLVS